jgi:hypothetical protein
MNTKALKLYGENPGFCQGVNLQCSFIEEVEPEIYETEDELFEIALERTYDDYLEFLDAGTKLFQTIQGYR